jgi:hypothetical protein
VSKVVKMVVRYLSGDKLWLGAEAGWYFGLQDDEGDMLDTVGPYTTKEEAVTDLPEGQTAEIIEVQQ